MIPSRFPWILALAFLPGIPSAPAQELPQPVLEKVRRSTVEVHIQGQLRGGGALVRDGEGKVHVLTAAHLFHSPRDTCSILTQEGNLHFASLSAYDLGHDLALLEVPEELARLGAIPVASSIPDDTSPIFNFGPALRRRTLVLKGTVADSRTCYTDFTSSGGFVAHFFAAGISPVLTSGGIWTNRKGEIVGVQHGRLKGEKGSASSGLSIVSPPSAVRKLLADRNVAKTPGLGGYVWEVWTADRSLLDELPRGTEGVFANPVFDGRPLARAGLETFDVIVSCDGKPVRRRHELLSAIRSKPAGSRFELEVIKPGSNERRRVELVTDTLEEHWK